MFMFYKTRYKTLARAWQSPPQQQQLNFNSDTTAATPSPLPKLKPHLSRSHAAEGTATDPCNKLFSNFYYVDMFSLRKAWPKLFQKAFS